MKLKDVTPTAFSCAGGCCPSVFETNRGTCLIIGSRVDSADRLLPGRVGPNEVAIEVPAELIRGIAVK